MGLNIESMATQIGTWTSEETIEVARLVLSEMHDDDIIELIYELAGGDETFTDELVAKFNMEDDHA